MPSVTILKFMVWSQILNQNYHLIKKFLVINLMLGISIYLVAGFISYPQIERGTI